MANRYSNNENLYSKRNFSEIIERLIPSLYIEDDIKTFGKADNILDIVIESHIKIADNIASIINVSDGSFFKSITTYDGIAPFFIKQNLYLESTPYDFYKTILLKDNTRLSDFDSKAVFKNYVDNDLIPKIQTNSPTLLTHDELIQNLGWFYFLASGNPSVEVEPSSIVSNYLVERVFESDGITLADGINCLTEYLWYNPSLNQYIPSMFLSSTGTYTSGTQQLEKLKTINNIIYSNEYFDRSDTKVYQAFDEYKTLNYFQKELLSDGPFWKLLKAFSFSFADIQNETDKIGILYDLQDCPDDLLPELAYLIGWELIGSDPKKWRLQLYNAVDIYKKTGTKQSIQAAINAVFTEGVVSLSSDIKELWESYLPFLAMYALATESYLFKSYDTWTRSVAGELGVDKYDLTNFETNIRLAVDKILLTLFEKHPNSFKIGGRTFPRNTVSFRFNYRGRDYPIPPFEEIPYYTTCEITEQLVTDLVDELVCFGVRPAFADQVGEYILNNTIRATDEIREENSWLMFTSSLEMPPNFNDLLSILGDKTEKYISLWNGKSSHYYLGFLAQDFDFTKVSYEEDSKQVILVASKAAKSFAPAHSIANFKVIAEDSDDYTATEDILQVLFFDSVESINNGPDTLTLTNYEDRGVNFLGNELEFSGLGRTKYDSLVSSVYVSGLLTQKERNTFRRRNYRSVLNINGYYDRTGFNQPMFLDSAIRDFTSTESDELLMLGYIPSSGQFYSGLTDDSCSGLLSSYHPTLERCNTKNSSNYFGYFTSSTLKSRGYESIPTELAGSANYLGRDDLDPFIYLIYRIETERVNRLAQKIVEDNYETYLADLRWKNVSGSIANGLLSCEPVISSLEEYRNYTFGQKIHRLFNLYTSSFNYHPTQKYSDTVNRSNILVHCFGSILNNSKFDIYGSKNSQYNFYASSLDTAVRLTPTSVYFSGTNQELEPYGSYLMTDASSLIAESPGEFPVTIEVANSGVAEYIDVIHTSGSSKFNEFTFYDIQNRRTTYSYDNPLIKLKSVGGLPRLRLKIAGSDKSETYETYREHFLHPDHEFKLSIKGLAALDDGSLLTDSRLGVWIHTDSESNKHSWHYNKDGRWELVHIDDITKDKILEELTHVIRFDDPDIGETSSVLRPCREETSETVDRTVNEFTEDFFSTKEIKFNTLNKCMNIIVPDSYYKDHGQVHRFDQTYVIEIFMIPSSDNFNKFILLDELSLRDETLWDYTRLELDPDLLHTMTHPLCSTKKLDLSADDIRAILRFYNTIAGRDLTEGPLGRSSLKSSYVNKTDGGGRLSYRFHPEFFSTDKNGFGQYTLLELVDPTDEDFTERSSFDPPPEVIEAIDGVPLEGEDPTLESLRYGFWFG